MTADKHVFQLNKNGVGIDKDGDSYVFYECKYCLEVFKSYMLDPKQHLYSSYVYGLIDECQNHPLNKGE